MLNSASSLVISFCLPIFFEPFSLVLNISFQKNYLTFQCHWKVLFEEVIYFFYNCCMWFLCTSFILLKIFFLNYLYILVLRQFLSDIFLTFKWGHSFRTSCVLNASLRRSWRSKLGQQIVSWWSCCLNSPSKISARE